MNLPADVSKVAPVYLVLTGEMMLDASLEEVWHHLINYPSWQNFPVVQPISGEPAKEGEVVLLRKEEKGFTFPAYYARTIKLDPLRRLIWKTYPEKTTPEANFFGIVDFTIQPAGGQTRFGYNTLYEFLVAYRDESELETFRKQQYENFAALFSVIFPKLKKLVEKGR